MSPASSIGFLKFIFDSNHDLFTRHIFLSCPSEGSWIIGKPSNGIQMSGSFWKWAAAGQRMKTHIGRAEVQCNDAGGMGHSIPFCGMLMISFNWLSLRFWSVNFFS
ncbi:MAG TPA: hypothetical protein DCR61_14955 [Verrucomicrobiales bacterium]|nr:hypothetical protein [Pedosphaera sp.]HAR00642.1 hypothetical protein [Verrucomicrobiales bacterium]HAW02784.1 hypothetical protein [Verrucomicrobiales bacterium]HBP56519.1 hypothetical protein [Verrucomicrobiales bacterium]HCP36794.1 hypothetical protein [Verrucomicrobiales bacterium]